MRAERLIYLYSIIPFISDQLNGFFREEFNIVSPISQITKTILLGGSIFYIALSPKSKKRHILYLIFFLTVSIIGSVNGMLNYNEYTISSFLTDLGYGLKLLSFPLVYITFLMIFKPYVGSLYGYHKIKATVLRIVNIQFFVLLIALLLGNMGYGISFYNTFSDYNTVGTQGYFIAGNELSAFYILLYGIVFYQFSKKGLLSILFILSLGILTGWLIGSKTAIGGSVLISIANIYLNKNYHGQIFKFTRIELAIVIFVVLAFVLVSVFIDEIIYFITPIIHLWDYKYRIVSEENIFAFLFSGRQHRLAYIVTEYLPNREFLESLFGEGYSYSKVTFIPSADGGYLPYSSSETDFVDMTSIFGILGSLGIYFVYLYMLKKTYYIYKHRIEEASIPIVFTFLVLIVLSQLSGHIVYASLMNFTAGIYIAFLDFSKKHFFRIAENEAMAEEAAKQEVRQTV